MASLIDYGKAILELKKAKMDSDYHAVIEKLSGGGSIDKSPSTYVPTPAGIGVGMAPFGPPTAPPPVTWTATWPTKSPVAVFLGTVCGGSLTIAVFGNSYDNSFDIYITHPSHTETPWTLHLKNNGVWDGRGVVTAVDHAVDCYLYANSHVATELGIAVSEPEPWPEHPTGYTRATYGTAVTSWASVPSAAASRSR